MHAAEVVMGEMQCQRCFQIVPLFGEGVSKPREPLALLAERTVLSFNMRCSGAVQIGIAANGVRVACAE